MAQIGLFWHFLNISLSKTLNYLKLVATRCLWGPSGWLERQSAKNTVRFLLHLFLKVGTCQLCRGRWWWVLQEPIWDKSRVHDGTWSPALFTYSRSALNQGSSAGRQVKQTLDILTPRPAACRTLAHRKDSRFNQVASEMFLSWLLMHSYCLTLTTSI